MNDNLLHLYILYLLFWGARIGLSLHLTPMGVLFFLKFIPMIYYNSVI
nr:MAG TPA: hypothetical protein [Caudoviricetes sp.]